jgi:methyl-accepting chemotaxis protein
VLVATLAVVLIGPRGGVVLGLAGSAIGVAAVVIAARAANLPEAELATHLVLSVLLVGVQLLCLGLFASQTRRDAGSLHDFAADIERVVRSAEQVAAGNLTQQVEGEGQVSQVVRGMQDNLRAIVEQIRSTVGRLAASTNEITAMVREQELGAQSQTQRVIEMRGALQVLLEGSRAITGSTQDVFLSIEKAQTSNDAIVKNIGALSDQAARITEILASIRDIAHKSEILALNASLEGVKAGHAGAGFSLVATQMQRLAENVVAAVRSIRDLTTDIAQVTQATVSSTREAAAQSAGAGDAVREIRLVVQQQQQGTERAARSIDDIAAVASEVSAGSSQALSASRDLTLVAHELDQLVARFKVR